jgi:hypothetical protein
LSDQLATIVTMVALVALLFADLAFIVVMHLFIPWRGNVWGKHVMFFSYAFATPMVFGLARLFFGDYPYRAQILALSYVVLAVAMCQRVYLAVREHMRELSRPRKE